MPKTLQERLKWLYENDPIFKAEKDEVDRIQQAQKNKNGYPNETSNKYFEVKDRPRN